MRTRWRGGAPCGEAASRTPLPGQPALPAPEGDWSRRGAWMRRQIDTGPVLVPDLSRRFTPTIAAFSLGTPSRRGQTVAELAFVEPATTLRDLEGRARAGFIATISTHPLAADFILEQPTALPPPGEGMVLHYSEPRSLPARNWLVGAA